MDLPEQLPPRWRDNMRLRRACLFHLRSEHALSGDEAHSVAQELIAANGTGEWDCRVVQLDTTGHDWEFRFKPHLAKARRTRLLSVRN